jgi:sugar phosphate isomerase/epimerase
MGYKWVELENLVSSNITLYSSENIKRIRSVMAEEGVRCPVFNANSVRDRLPSTDAALRAEALAEFRRLGDVAAALETEAGICTINETPERFAVRGEEIYYDSPSMSMELPPDWRWEDVWAYYVDTVAQCVEIASERDLRFSLEVFPNAIISTTDGFLRLWEAIGSESFGMVFDTGHLFYLREPLTVSVEKLGSRLFVAHMSDNDGLVNHHWPPGRGSIDFGKLLRAFKKIEFKGPMIVEGITKGFDEWDQMYLEGRRYLQSILERLEGEGVGAKA